MRRRYDGGKEIGNTDYINSRYSLGLVWSEWTVLDVTWCFSGYDYLPAFVGIGILSRYLAYATAKEQLLIVLKNRKALLGIFVFAMLGLVLNQMAYLQAIYHTNAGTATVLQYLCPILVLAYTCLKNREKPSGIELISIILAVAGTF